MAKKKKDVNNNVTAKPPEGFIIVNAVEPWLQQQISENFADNKFFRIVMFYIIHSPCKESSYSRVDLEKYGWKNPWHYDAFKAEFDKIAGFVDEENYRSVSVVKYDIDLDIAVLKIDCCKKLSPIKIVEDDSIQYGDRVYAVGNMSNYGLSITSGIVSIPYVNVSFEDKIRSVIQCDLTISDGNSGGALVDNNGRLLGLTTFRLKDKSNNVIYGISYSIPAGTIMEYILN
jgi:hypothetical protein